MNEQKQATPAEELRRQFMDHSTPLTEAGHWARRRIEQLEARQATDLHEGEHKVFDFNEPVTEAEWWAKGRIEQLEAENARTNARLIELAAQMATRRGMPSPDDWPGWGPRVPQKLWRAARDEFMRELSAIESENDQLRKDVKTLRDALKHAVLYVPDLATVPGIQKALAATEPKP